MSKKIVAYTTTWCPDCRAAKKFLQSKGIPFEEVDIEQSPEGAQKVMKLNNGMRVVPTLDIEGTIVIGDSFNPEKFEKDLQDAGVI